MTIKAGRGRVKGTNDKHNQSEGDVAADAESRGKNVRMKTNGTLVLYEVGWRTERRRKS